MVNVLRAVVRVETANDKREAVDEYFEIGDEEELADLRNTEDALPLSDLVDGVDVVEDPDPMEIALMYAVDAQVARFVVGPWLTPLTDSDATRTSLGERLPLSLVAAGTAQVMQVPVGDPGKMCEALVAEHVQSPFAKLAGCRA